MARTLFRARGHCENEENQMHISELRAELHVRWAVTRLGFNDFSTYITRRGPRLG